MLDGILGTYLVPAVCLCVAEEKAASATGKDGGVHNKLQDPATGNYCTVIADCGKLHVDERRS